MAITTTTTKTYKQFLSYAKKLRREVVLDLRDKLKTEVLELMEDGISPTQGGAWEPEYSQKYKSQIVAGKYPGKTISPVNLKLTGKLYRSLKSTAKIVAGTITLRFTDSKAKQHDEGLGHLPKRRLLPNDGERFQASIRTLLTRSVENFSIKLAKRSSDR